MKSRFTLMLAAICVALMGIAQLHATTPGTYGSIRETLRHLVEAEEGYLSILTNQWASCMSSRRPGA